MKPSSSRTNSVEKAMRILLAFQADHTAWGVRQLSAHLGFSPATVQRILQTLKQFRFVDQDPDSQQYRLGNVFYQFLDVLQQGSPIIRVARPFMERLLAHTQETVHLNAIDGNERLCIDSLDSPQYIKASMPVGNRSPLYAGASSKCLLAFAGQAFITQYLKATPLVPLTPNTISGVKAIKQELQRIRREKHAVSLGERTPGLGALSAPIVNYRGLLLGALSLAIPEFRFKDATHRHSCLHELLATAGELSSAMGAPPKEKPSDS